MRRQFSLQNISARASLRSLFLRVDGTAAPQRFPKGYVPLTGDEPIDTVFDMLKEGHFVAPTKTIESIHNVHIGVRKLLLKELPHATFDEVVHFQRRHRELSAKILVQRDFWALDDYNDSELNRSFGIQNLYFDNYQWSTKLWKEFITFASRWFPLNDHSHLMYDEYLKLLRAFSASIEGLRVLPLLPKNARLRPSFCSPVPSKLQRQPMVLFRVWLENFRKPLGLQKALVVRGGCGLLALVTRSCGVPMVRMSDPSPSAVEAARKDSLQLASLFHSISYQVASLFPDEIGHTRSESTGNNDEASRKGKYDLIVYYPDQHLLQGFGDEPYAFAPGMIGYRGDLEAFLEQAGEYLTENGVVAICTSNFSALADPSAPHPIEYEVKVNRRWIILDYYDRELTKAIAQGDPDGVSSVPLLGEMKKKLKAELWVLHRVESLKSFAHIHKIPGAEAPSTTRGHWRHKSLSTHRRRAMKQQVELMGGNWGDYKERLVNMLQDTNDKDEDETAEAVRMTLDPTYPSVLAERARVAMEQNQKEKLEFHEAVRTTFRDQSPRAVFDAHASQVQASDVGRLGKLQRAAAERSS